MGLGASDKWFESFVFWNGNRARAHAHAHAGIEILKKGMAKPGKKNWHCMRICIYRMESFIVLRFIASSSFCAARPIFYID